MRIVVLIVVIWLIVGVVATWQRGYFGGREDPGCERIGTIAVTIVAGPLNYVGVNPKIKECDLPEPSQ